MNNSESDSEEVEIIDSEDTIETTRIIRRLANLIPALSDKAEFTPNDLRGGLNR